MNAIRYHWELRTIDGEDILDCWEAENLKDLPVSLPLKSTDTLVLVRSYTYKGHTSRVEAHVYNTQLGLFPLLPTHYPQSRSNYPPAKVTEWHHTQLRNKERG